MLREQGHCSQQVPLLLGLRPDKNCGWGICSQYLVHELSKLTDVRLLYEDNNESTDQCLPGKLFQGVENEDLIPFLQRTRGVQNYAYTFFENELSATSVQNAQLFDLVLAGSTWCRDRLLERGIHNCGVLLQGIDPELFYPLAHKPNKDHFVIFSGGKFEYRKGQDLVLKAVKILQQKYADILLVNCWFNTFPHSLTMMTVSKHIQFSGIETDSWSRFMRHIYAINGISEERITTHEYLPQDGLREIYSQTDVGVFPNRCEGGTNLVMMEYMACAKPVIASNTSGHRDIVNHDNAILLEQLKDITVANNGTLVARWQEPSLDELVSKIEHVYHHRDSLAAIGRRAGEDMRRFSWSHSAQSLLSSLGISY